MAEKENTEIRNDINRMRKAMQDEVKSTKRGKTIILTLMTSK
jgi:hypothetical protein